MSTDIVINVSVGDHGRAGEIAAAIEEALSGLRGNELVLALEVAADDERDLNAVLGTVGIALAVAATVPKNLSGLLDEIARVLRSLQGVRAAYVELRDGPKPLAETTGEDLLDAG
ncbi:hypothetical protein R8Z50_19380 [Longispora sp. K20-0274]|uniref:hypothetical protein n=1 Tax=Longispora sp. K20-0274 TaxID=3088255 RepID=UPI00399964A2